MRKLKLTSTEVLILRRTPESMISQNDFKYPTNGPVEAPDWKETDECGYGLHGLLWGAGGFDISSYGELFQVIKVDKNDGLIELDGGDKIKYKKGFVLLTTKDQKEAIDFILNYAPDEVKGKINYQTQTAGSDSTQTAGNRSTQTAGNRSTQTAGSDSTQTAGNRSTQTAGSYSFHCIKGRDAIIKPNEHSVIAMSYNDGYKGQSTAFLFGVDFNRGDILKIKNMKIEKVYTTTPDKITDLEEFEIFVFGSNLNGNHAGGAAKIAKDKFGAVQGVSEGITGKSYAFPTLDKDMNKVQSSDLKKYADNLIQVAIKNPKYIFFLTKVGCGIAGFSESEVKRYFASTPANIIKPENW